MFLRLFGFFWRLWYWMWLLLRWRVVVVFWFVRFWYIWGFCVDVVFVGVVRLRCCG